MALNFPTSPAVDEIYSNWKWDGNKWTLIEREPANIPTGGIILWSGSAASIPSGYVLCDGSNGTPDLRGRFVVGGGGSYSPNTAGGSLLTGSTALTVDQMPAHSHTTGYLPAGAGSDIPYMGGPGYASLASDTGSTGGGAGHEHSILPPYYALCYIMKT